MSIDVEFVKEYKDFENWLHRKYDIGPNLFHCMSSISMFQFYREYFLECHHGKS